MTTTRPVDVAVAVEYVIWIVVMTRRGGRDDGKHLSSGNGSKTAAMLSTVSTTDGSVVVAVVAFLEWLLLLLLLLRSRTRRRSCRCRNDRHASVVGLADRLCAVVGIIAVVIPRPHAAFSCRCSGRFSCWSNSSHLANFRCLHQHCLFHSRRRRR